MYSPTKFSVALVATPTQETLDLAGTDFVHDLQFNSHLMTVLTEFQEDEINGAIYAIFVQRLDYCPETDSELTAEIECKTDVTDGRLIFSYTGYGGMFPTDWRWEIKDTVSVKTFVDACRQAWNPG